MSLGPARLYPTTAALNLPGAALTPSVPAFTDTTINGRRICRAVTPWSANLQVKANGSYPLPYDIVVSGAIQNVAGPLVTASYATPNAMIAPSLGRNLAACGSRIPCTSTVNIPLIAPQTMFEDRRTQIDLRLTKFVRIPRGRVQLNFDVYNALNASNVLTINTNYGPSWLQPTSFLPGRLFELSGQLSF